MWMADKCNTLNMVMVQTHKNMFHKLAHMNRALQLVLHNSLSTELVKVRSIRSCLLMVGSSSMVLLVMALHQCCNFQLIHHNSKAQLWVVHSNQSRQEEMVHKCNSSQLRAHSSSMRDMEKAQILGSMIEWILHTSREELMVQHSNCSRQLGLAHMASILLWVHCRSNSIPLVMEMENTSSFGFPQSMNRDQRLVLHSTECKLLNKMEKSLECMGFLLQLQVQCILFLILLLSIQIPRKHHMIMMVQHKEMKKQFLPILELMEQK